MKNYNYDYIVIIHHDEEGEEQDQHRWHYQFHVLEYQNSVGESYFCPCNKVPHANLIGWSDVEMRSEKFKRFFQKRFSGDSSNLFVQIGDVEGCTVFATRLRLLFLL